jgi:hypothetical protein
MAYTRMVRGEGMVVHVLRVTLEEIVIPFTRIGEGVAALIRTVPEGDVVAHTWTPPEGGVVARIKVVMATISKIPRYSISAHNY